MKRETYYLQSAAIQRAAALMGTGYRVNFYNDTQDGKRFWVVEFIK